jgi:hypothetical protein
MKQFNALAYAGQAIVLAIVLVGCGNNDPSLSLSSDSNEFYQDVESKALNSKIDILWVVDNSGSMDTSQVNVANNFQSFINDFQNKGYDYRIAVTTTEAYRALYGGSPSQFSKFRDGTNATSHSGVFIIEPDTPDLTNVFMTNILQGTSGSGNERAFQSITAALDEPLNAGFLRPDAFLSVVIVSDEDDFSADTQSWITSYSDSRLHSVQRYVDYLDTVKDVQPGVQSYSVSAVAIFDEACRDELNLSWTGRLIGQRYGELVDATGGVKGSLCGDFASTLATVAENVLTLATQFYLTRVPIESSIVVKLNGVVVPKSEGNANGGWKYLSETNSIQFTGDYIPQAGAKINVDFDPVAFGS